MLADAPRGVTEEMLVVVHGFSGEMIANLVLAGLATVVTENKSAPRGVTIKVERICITDAEQHEVEEAVHEAERGARQAALRVARDWGHPGQLFLPGRGNGHRSPWINEVLLTGPGPAPIERIA